MRVLFIEDAFDLAKITANNLKTQGFAVDIAPTGEDARLLLEDSTDFDAIILDLCLPDVTGMELIEYIKNNQPLMPILALTGKDSEEDRVEGILAGADDYITKPFSYIELAARIRILLRSRKPSIGKDITLGKLSINLLQKTVLDQDKPLKLTLTEFRLLAYLASNQERIIPRRELIENVWDYSMKNGNDKLTTMISRVRKKIGDDKKEIIITCKKGYCCSKNITC